MGTIKTFGSVDQRSLNQLERCMEAGDAEFGVLCADHHPGYSQPIGGGIAYEGYVSPSGVGYDIGCGNKAARTELTRDQLDALGGVESIMREITRRISFGMGVPARERVDHPVLEKIRTADFAPQRKLAQTAEFNIVRNWVDCRQQIPGAIASAFAFDAGHECLLCYQYSFD